jgi:hypothetical protein
MIRVFVLALALAGSTQAFAQGAAKNEVSEKTLRILKNLAWQSLPSKIIQPDRSVVEIDKSDPSKIIIPDTEARDIIKGAYLTARAHRCDLQELVVANRDAILMREKQRNKWSSAQLQYINSLHLYTVQLLVGKVQVSEGDQPKPDFDPKTAQMPADNIAQCSDKEKQDILAAVEANEKQVRKS